MSLCVLGGHVFLWEDFECTVLNGVCCGLGACSVFWYCCIVSWGVFGVGRGRFGLQIVSCFDVCV